MKFFFGWYRYLFLQSAKKRNYQNNSFQIFFAAIFAKPFVFVCLFIFSCATGQNAPDLTPERKLSLYPSLYHLPVYERVASPPEHLLKYIKYLDAREDYRAYIPDKSVSQQMKQIIQKLPPLNIRALEEGVSAIYFIENFMGSGMTDWLIDDNGKIHTYVILNPDVLRMNMSELLTKKEQSAFVHGLQTVSITPDGSSLLYILLHESVHVADYIYRITDCVEFTVCSFQNRMSVMPDFGIDVWKTGIQPVSSYSFTGKVSFYGLGNKYSGDVHRVYSDLLTSPFVSLYSSLSRTEDIAELLTFYHLTYILKKKYAIRLDNKEFFPADNPVVKKRLAKIKIFYQ